MLGCSFHGFWEASVWRFLLRRILVLELFGLKNQVSHIGLQNVAVQFHVLEFRGAAWCSSLCYVFGRHLRRDSRTCVITSLPNTSAMYRLNRTESKRPHEALLLLRLLLLLLLPIWYLGVAPAQYLNMITLRDHTQVWRPNNKYSATLCGGKCSNGGRNLNPFRSGS